MSDLRADSRFFGKSLCYLAIFILIENELGGLTTWVDDERIPVEPLEHDGVLRAEIVSWKRFRLPSQPFIWVRQELSPCQVRPVGDVRRLQMVGPGREQGVSVLLVKISTIGKEGR